MIDASCRERPGTGASAQDEEESAMRSLALISTICVLPLALACGGREPVPVSGVDTLVVQVVDSIGLETGDSNYVFFALEGAAWGPDGSIAALDMVRGCVMVYAPDGTFQRSIGSRGNGPGELQDIGFIAISQDGHMYLSGEGNQLLGLHVFDCISGEWLGSYSLHGSPPTCLEGGPGDLCLLKQIRRNPDNPLGAIVEFYWAGPDSVVADSLWLDEFEFSTDNMATVVEKTWYGYDLAVAPDGGFFIAPRSSAEYVVHRWEASGAPLPDITMQMDPVAKTQDELETESMLLSLKANVMGLPAGVPMSPDPFRPMIRGLEVDPAGNLWVLRGTQEQPFFDIYDPQGGLTAHARLGSTPPDGQTWRFAFGAQGILAWSEDPASGYQKLYVLEYP
jgi:hypothetical protein